MTSTGPITVFCPNDDAFGDLCQKIGVSKMDLMNDPRIPAIVGTHIVQARPPLAPPVPARPRPRGARRSLRTFARDSLRAAATPFNSD